MSPTIGLTLTEQEQKIVNYLADKEQVAWEELAQFSKIPTQVKRNTLLKVVSDLRKKYKTVGLPDPINVNFYDLTKSSFSPSGTVQAETVHAGSSSVQMRKTLGGRMVRADNTALDAHLDFELDKGNRRVKTKNGWVALSESCFELFRIFHENAGSPLSKEVLKDKIWPQWGSKVPASWWGNLSARMTNLRTSLPELKTRLNRLVMDGNSSFMLR